MAGYSPWGHKESEATERLHFHSCCALGTVVFKKERNDDDYGDDGSSNRGTELSESRHLG